MNFLNLMGTNRWRDYLMCNERGHQASGQVLTSDPPWQICRFCGTAYRYEEHFVEMNTPQPPRDSD